MVMPSKQTPIKKSTVSLIKAPSDERSSLPSTNATTTGATSSATKETREPTPRIENSQKENEKPP
jgi:hypothetical protein